MARLVILLLLLLLILHGDARSRVLPHLFPTTLYREGDKPSEYCKQTLLLPTAGIEPGPPMQQASAQAITL